jgi:hypothetical protein
METINKKNGGRPRKFNPRKHRLRVACDNEELSIIKDKARICQLTISEFLRTSAVGSHVVTKKEKTLPKEVLQFTAALNHLAANINSLAYKNNRAENFNPMERAELKLLATKVQKLGDEIKKYLQP